MRCYTLIPRVSGYIEDWTAMIPHIAGLGFDTIHLLPITQMGSSMSPYSTTNPYEIDPMYDKNGDSEHAAAKFAEFIRSLCAHKIRLCVDIVLNHISVEHPIFRTHKEWAIHDDSEEDRIKRAGWSDGKNWHKWNDLGLLNYESNMGSPLWDYMYNYVIYWAEFAAATDGYIRLDNLHSSHKAFVEYVLLQVKNLYPNVQVFSELFADEAIIRNLINKYHFTYLLATQWEHKFIADIRNYIKYIHSRSLPIRFLLPVLSHDSGSIVDEYGSIKSTVPRIAISALLGSGDWGIVQGVEYGIEQKLEFIGELVPLAWNTKYYGVHAAFKNYISSLNDLIKKHRLFTEQGNIEMIEEAHPTIISALRFAPADEQQSHDTLDYAIILINIDIAHAKEFIIDAHLLGMHHINIDKVTHLKDMLSNKKYMFSKDEGKQIVFNLKAGEVLVLQAI